MGKVAVVVLTAFGGLFYLAGAFVGGLIAAAFGLAAVLTGHASSGGTASVVGLVFYLGVASGLAIIVGGALVFASSRLRRIGGILVVAMALVGAVPIVGG